MEDENSLKKVCERKGFFKTKEWAEEFLARENITILEPYICPNGWDHFHLRNAVRKRRKKK